VPPVDADPIWPSSRPTCAASAGLEGFIEAIATIKPKTHDPFFSVLGMLCYGAAFRP
jgi:hypothetical protein